MNPTFTHRQAVLSFWRHWPLLLYHGSLVSNHKLKHMGSFPLIGNLNTLVPGPAQTRVNICSIEQRCTFQNYVPFPCNLLTKTHG